MRKHENQVQFAKMLLTVRGIGGVTGVATLKNHPNA
jgi:hypothetical protein